MTLEVTLTIKIQAIMLVKKFSLLLLHGVLVFLCIFIDETSWDGCRWQQMHWQRVQMNALQMVWTHLYQNLLHSTSWKNVLNSIYHDILELCGSFWAIYISSYAQPLKSVHSICQFHSFDLLFLRTLSQFVLLAGNNENDIRKL